MLAFCLEIGGIGPGTANPHIARADLLGQRTQPPVAQIFRRARAIHFISRPAVGCPEPSTRHFYHFNIGTESARRSLQSLAALKALARNSLTMTG